MTSQHSHPNAGKGSSVAGDIDAAAASLDALEAWRTAHAAEHAAADYLKVWVPA